MASREELAEADMLNRPELLPADIPRITVRPLGVEAPPEAPEGRPQPPWQGGRLFEPDLTPAKQPSRLQPISIGGWEPSLVGGAQAIGRGLGSLVSGAGAYLNRPLAQAPSRAPVDPTAGPRQMWQQGYPSSDQPSAVERGAGAVGSAIAAVPGQIEELVESQRVMFDPKATPEEREYAREIGIKRAADVTMNLAGTSAPFAAGRAGTVGALGGRPSPLLRSPGRTMKEENWLPVTPAPFVKDPQRTYSPGIYKNPKQIAAEAGAQTAAEHPALKELFGVTRDDLWQIGEKGTRKGNVDPKLWTPDKPGGSYVAEAIMNPANAQRQIDAMVEARKFPALSKGMEAWYVMDPAFQRMVQLVGKDQAIKDYRRFNAIMTPFSSNSTVMEEIRRGTGARMMADLGRFEEFAKYGGGPVAKRGKDFPAIMRDIPPHLRHGGHTPAVERWLKTGEHGYAKETVKNPLYTLASGVPETGFQTTHAVPDAHLARASGAADVRTTKDPGAYMGATEYRQFAPWFRENIAKPMGIQAVPAQGLEWGTFAPQTGVKTAIGAPKLELLAQLIWERAHKLGVDPKWLRDQVLMGKEHALLAIGVGVGGAAGGMGSVVAPTRQEVQ